MIKKNFLLTLMILFLVMVHTLFLSCSGKIENEKTTIMFLTDQTQTSRLAQIQLLMDTFEALNPEYQVELTAVDINELTQQVATAVSSNTMPNLIHSVTQFLLSIDEEGLIDTKAGEEVVKSLVKINFIKVLLILVLV